MDNFSFISIVFIILKLDLWHFTSLHYKECSVTSICQSCSSILFQFRDGLHL